MTKRRVTLTLNWFLLLALILASCTGVPVPIISSTSTPAIPTPTSFQQSLPPALVETDPPLGSVIGYQSPITFYFNQPVNKSSAEAALTGLPAGTFTWNDDATLDVFAYATLSTQYNAKFLDCKFHPIHKWIWDGSPHRSFLHGCRLFARQPISCQSQTQKMSTSMRPLSFPLISRSLHWEVTPPRNLLHSTFSLP